MEGLLSTGPTPSSIYHEIFFENNRFTSVMTKLLRKKSRKKNLSCCGFYILLHLQNNIVNFFLKFAI